MVLKLESSDLECNALTKCATLAYLGSWVLLLGPKAWLGDKWILHTKISLLLESRSSILVLITEYAKTQASDLHIFLKAVFYCQKFVKVINLLLYIIWYHFFKSGVEKLQWFAKYIKAYLLKRRLAFCSSMFKQVPAIYNLQSSLWYFRTSWFLNWAKQSDQNCIYRWRTS